MFGDTYYRGGDVSHHISVKAAPSGESIRYADDIRKELLDKAERAFKERVSFDLKDPELGKIKLTVTGRMDYARTDYMVYYKLNDKVHTVAFDPYVYGTRQQMLEAFFDKLSQHIASRLMLSFAEGDKFRLFGDMK